MNTNRRNFLKLIGGASAGIGLSNWILSSLFSSPNYSEEELTSGLGFETWTNSLCGLCGCGCGISVRSIDGIPIKIEGNKLHPMNQGGLCARGLAGLEVIYNPDRITSPMRRLGERGEKKWESITWDEAIDVLSQNLMKLQKTKHNDKLAFLTNNISGPLNQLLKRFSEAFGTPYYFNCSQTNNNKIHYNLMHGTNQEFAYDLENTNYILSFGSHFLESEGAQGWYTRMYGQLRQGKRAKIVQIDPQLSITGMKADKWISIKPGTYGAIALGIAHIIIRENLVDSNFIKHNTFGYDDWQDKSGKHHSGFKTMVLLNYSPEKVEKVTGLNTEILVKIAREFAASEAPLALIGNRCSWNSNGTHTMRAVHALNALVGNIGKSGGIIPKKKIPFTKLSTKESSNNKKSNFNKQFNNDWINADSVTELLNNDSSQIQTLFLYNSNPHYFTTKPGHFHKALNNIPFIVSFSSFQDESSQYADLLLPDHLYLEKWQVATSPFEVAGLHVGVSAPTMKPLYNTRDTGNVILQISKKVGGKIEKNLPWDNITEYYKDRIKGIYTSNRGTAFSESYNESWIKLLEERGWRYPAYYSFEEFWDDLNKKGGWWEPQFKEKSLAFHTPSKKFEFYSQILKTNMSSIDPQIQTPENDEWFLPHYEEILHPKNESDYNLSLNPYLLTTIGSGEGTNQPMMMEMLGIHIKKKWNSWIEINPQDAKKLKLSDFDLVWVVTSKKKIITQLRILPTTAPGVVNIPMGMGHNGYSRFADNKGINPIHLLKSKTDPITGMIAYSETKVKLIKV